MFSTCFQAVLSNSPPGIMLMSEVVLLSSVFTSYGITDQMTVPKAHYFVLCFLTIICYPEVQADTLEDYK
jgi:hypothetical protein